MQTVQSVYKVLDHGYVRYVDHMGSDESIVEAARMSTGRGFVSWEPYKRCRKCDVPFLTHRLDGSEIVYRKECEVGGLHDWQAFPRGDLGMLDFMWKNKHATPFEFAELHVEVQAPIFVFREWHRHRTFSFSEFSARYSQMPNLHYLPSPDRVQKQSTTNRQGSGAAFGEELAAGFITKWEIEQQEVYETYDNFVGAHGVAKEIARLNTPVSRYSKMRAKTDLRNWLAFLKLRMASSAQWEIRQYANACAEIVKQLWPRTWALFEEHDLHGVNLSRTDAARLREVLTYWYGSGESAHGSDEVSALLKKLGGV